MKKTVAWVASKMKDNKGFILGAFTMQRLNEMSGKRFRVVPKLYQAALALSGLTNKLMTESDELDRKWAKIDKKIRSDGFGHAPGDDSRARSGYYDAEGRGQDQNPVDEGRKGTGSDAAES